MAKTAATTSSKMALATKRVRRTPPAKVLAASVEVGTGNVFRDLELPDADVLQLKVQMAMRVNALLVEAGLTQAQTAERLGIAQPHVSDLVHYKLSRFSVDRLIQFATLLDRDVEILIRPRSARHATGTVSVLVAA